MHLTPFCPHLAHSGKRLSHFRLALAQVRQAFASRLATILVDGFCKRWMSMESGGLSTASGLNAVWLLRRLASSHTSDQRVAFLPLHKLLRALSRHSLALSENKSSFGKLPHCIIFFTTFSKHHPQRLHRMHIIRVSLDSSLSARVATDRSRTDDRKSIMISDEREYECS